MIRIKQILCNAGEHFKQALIKKYNLVRYVDSNEPVFCMGCYGETQINTICNHNSNVVLMWSGTDALIASSNENIIDKLHNAPHIKHMAISNFIEADLQKMGLEYTRMPIIAYNNVNIKSEPLGDSIYIYKSQFITYGRILNNKIKELLPDINFIECDFHSYSREDLLKEYKKCFLGLRFINHDGLSNTVCELGLMGRKVIWNGNTPNAINYDKDNIEDIIIKIKKEYDNRFSNKYLDVAKKTKEYLDIGDSFLYIKQKYNT